MKARGFLFLAALAASLATASCATDIDDIDRTQNDKLEKALFQGVWYLNQTVADIPFSAVFTFVGETNFGATGKVIFDVQEKQLVVFPVVEYIEDSEEPWRSQKIFKYWEKDCLTRASEDPAHQCADGVGSDGKVGTGCCFIDVYVGQPVAAFEISSHFDVKRQYNAATGEQSPVIEENSTDKYWWQRAYMRVNWSKSLINDFTYMAKSVTQSPIDYYVQSFDPTNPDAPTLTKDYIDVVLKQFGEPESAGTCNVWGLSTGDCAPAVVKFRMAFRKVDPAQDYEPTHYTNEDQMRLFGFFLTERYGFDEAKGTVYTDKVSFANRWNLWRHSFNEEPITPEKPCFKDLKDTGCDRTNVDGAKEFCQADDWFTYGKCVKRTTRNYRDRGLRPIVFHVSPNLPAELWPASVRTAEEWSDTMKETVAWLYFWEEKNAIRGQTAAQRCETNADCTPDALVDTIVSIDEAERTSLPLPADTNVYKTASPKKCTSDSACPQARLCDMRLLPPGAPCNTVAGPQCVKDFVLQGTPTNYCATCASDGDCRPWGGAEDGTCVRGVCMTGNWSAMAKTVVMAAGRTVVVPDWGFPSLTGTDGPLCAVRLLNLGSEPATLAIGGKDVQTAAPVETTTDPGAVPYVTLPANGTATKAAVGGTELDFTCAGDAGFRYVTTFVWANGRLVSATSTSVAVAGLRVFNLLGDDVDLSIDGALRFAALKDGVHTGHMHVGGGTGSTTLPADIPPHRVVAMKAGSAGNITCFRSDEVSNCVGYRPQMTPADWARKDEIKKNLPELLVMCPNAIDETTAAQADQWKSRLFGPWTEVGPAAAAGATGNLPEMNPCVDFLFGFDTLPRRMGAEQAKAELAKQAAAMKKIGDSRYSSIYWIPDAQGASPLGYGPSAADPDSGEIYWATANIYGAPLYTAAAMYRDLFDLINGKLDTQDYVLGKVIRERVLGRNAGSTGGALTSALIEEPLPVEVPEASTAPAQKLPLFNDKGRPLSPRQIASQIHQIELGQQLPKGIPQVKPTFAKDRLAALKGTPWEEMLKSDEVKVGLAAFADHAGHDHGESPLEWANLGDLMAKERERQIYLSSHNYCKGDFNDEGMIGTAMAWGCRPNDDRPVCDPADFDPMAWEPASKVYRDDMGITNKAGKKCCINDGELIYKAILQRYYLAVTEHEVGHTVGLRHNFEGSSDLFNFQDHYYDVREREPIPCGDDQECELSIGQSCVKGYCTVIQPTGQVDGQPGCTTDLECGYFFPNLDQSQRNFNPGNYACEPAVACKVDGDCKGGKDLKCLLKPGASKGYCGVDLFARCTAEGDCGTARGGTCKADAHCPGAGQKCFKAAGADEGNCGVEWDLSGGCVEHKRCGMHGECPSGATCNGQDWTCRDADGRHVTAPVLFDDADDGDNAHVIHQMIPRGPMTEAEAMANRTAYQYSTIMDYGQRWNSDIVGLGKYDYAAIQMGYGNLIQTYTDLSQLYRNANMSSQLYGYSNEALAADFDSSWWGGGIFSSQFAFLNNYIGVDQNRSQKTATFDGTKNRLPVPWEWVRLEHVMSENFYRQVGDWSYVIAPYKFCGDEYAGNVGCYTWDTGVDPLEIVHNMSLELKDYYLLDAFKRDRYGFGLHGSALSYLSRITTRWMEPMRGAGMYYALYSHILKNYSWRGLWTNGRMLGWGLRRASETGFEALANSFASPAPGSFKLDPATNVYRNFGYDTGMQGSELDVPLGIGKYPYTTFYENAGYFSWDHAAYIGSFWEKLGALLTICDSTVYFTTNYVGEQLNVGVGTSIGFNTMYPRQLSSLFGGLVAEDVEQFSLSYDPATGKAAPRAFFDPMNRDVYTDISPKPFLTPAKVPTTPLIDPSIVNATMKLYAMVFGMALLPASFDPAFLDSFNLCLDGTGDCYAPGGPDVEEVRFTDPFTGRTYRALAPAYQKGWYAANVALLDKAAALEADWTAETDAGVKAKIENDLRRMVEAMEMMRGIYRTFSTLQIVGT
ncbi:MAG: hypothetical protein FJ087_01885 [Deltaproteobacteria bacterium]|nr:hypothetical protein [Deltaproteobacteria bacterium]